jgi:hypothetical protein
VSVFSLLSFLFSSFQSVVILPFLIYLHSRGLAPPVLFKKKLCTLRDSVDTLYKFGNIKMYFKSLGPK